MDDMLYIGIDPGDVRSAVSGVIGERVIVGGIYPNEQVVPAACSMAFKLAMGGSIDGSSAVRFGIEMIASYGMPVGKTVFETCVWIGRFVEGIRDHKADDTIPIRKVYRKDAKMHLCQSMRAKDGNIRQAIIDLYPPTGGGQIPQIGTKSQPGPLFGAAKDMWASVAVAITARAMWEKLESF